MSDDVWLMLLYTFFGFLVTGVAVVKYLKLKKIGE